MHALCRRARFRGSPSLPCWRWGPFVAASVLQVWTLSSVLLLKHVLYSDSAMHGGDGGVVAAEGGGGLAGLGWGGVGWWQSSSGDKSCLCSVP